jgi:hypothetical protein
MAMPWIIRITGVILMLSADDLADLVVESGPLHFAIGLAIVVIALVAFIVGPRSASWTRRESR